MGGIAGSQEQRLSIPNLESLVLGRQHPGQAGFEAQNCLEQHMRVVGSFACARVLAVFFLCSSVAGQPAPVCCFATMLDWVLLEANYLFAPGAESVHGMTNEGTSFKAVGRPWHILGRVLPIAPQ